MRHAINLCRDVAPIFGERIRMRTFHHSRDYHATSGGADRPACTIDAVVTLTMPLLAFQHPHGIACRRVDL